MGQIKDPGSGHIHHGFENTGLTERQKGRDVKARGGAAAKSQRDNPRPSEVFDWDKALRLNRQTRKEVYGG